MKKNRVFLPFILILLLLVSVGSAFSDEIDTQRGEAVSGDHPLVNHFGDTAQSGVGSWGSRWIHTDPTGTRYGLRGETLSNAGRGVLGWARATTGTPYGVWGYAESNSGRGVVGHTPSGSGVTYGVWGQSNSTSGRGTLGYATATSGTTYGVWGYASSSGGRGVVGQAPSGSGLTYGVWGQSDSTGGRGTLGYATATSGTTYGVWGYANSSAGRGVYGYNNSSGVGVWGRAAGSSGTGVYASGVRYGTRSYSSSTSGDGVYVRTTATSGPAWAINARTESPDGWAAYLTSAGNGVLVSTPNNKVGLTVLGGSKNAAVSTDDGDRLLYTEESTEVWFTDYGFAKLIDGVAVINIDPTFAQTVNLDESYHVFLQAYGDAELYVSGRTATGFEVRLGDGDANVEFSYRLVGKRLGFEDQRLELAPWAGEDAALYEMKADEQANIEASEANLDAAEDLELEALEANLDAAEGLEP